LTYACLACTMVSVNQLNTDLRAAANAALVEETSTSAACRLAGVAKHSDQMGAG